MICIMHQAEPYGHLVVNGKAIQPDTLARMVGCTPTECRKWLAELEDAGVFDRDGDVVISRRMVKDECIRKLRAEGGKLGGNPALMDKGKVSKKVNGKDNLPPNLQPTPSSSSSSSSSVNTPSAASLADAQFERFWAMYPKRAGGNPKPRARRAWLARLAEGHSSAEVMAGLERYAAYIRAAGKEGTEFVQQAATFLGPDKRFLEAWEAQEGGLYSRRGVM